MSEPKSIRNDKVLIVDDQTYFRTMVRDQMRKLGFTEIFEATDGQEALFLLPKVAPDLILLDINMKPMDGLEFLSRLRSSPNAPDPRVPVIILTSHAESEKVRRAVELGAAAYMVKPIVFLDLRARIATVLSRRPRRG